METFYRPACLIRFWREFHARLLKREKGQSDSFRGKQRRAITLSGGRERVGKLTSGGSKEGTKSESEEGRKESAETRGRRVLEGGQLKGDQLAGGRDMEPYPGSSACIQGKRE